MDYGNLIERDIHRPINCEKCGERLEYKGIGEYQCPECKELYYDDYGKVRNYLESHKGATQVEVAEATGVTPNTIRQLLREDRLEVTPNSAIFLMCEICGTSIRSGRFCSKCQSSRAASMQNAQKSASPRNIQGFGKGQIDTSGAKRFNR